MSYADTMSAIGAKRREIDALRQEMRAQQARQGRECRVRSATPIDAFEVSVKIKGIGHRHPPIIAIALRPSLGHCL